MHRPSNMRFAVPVAVVASAFVLAGCGPIAFQGQNAIQISGAAPAPPPKPEPPPEPESRAKLVDNRIEITEKIQFDYNAATIKEVSFSLLDEIASVIKQNPHVKKVSIEGHASSEGDDNYNLRLSDSRAKAVMKYLVDKGGIAADRLTAKGFGETKPIATNDTEDGREQNRRVEFNVTEQEVTEKEVEEPPTTSNKVKTPGQ